MSIPAAGRSSSPIPRILTAALVVGVLDISYVMVLWVLIRKATTATRIWQSIASGLLGKAAYDGGVGTAILGGALHFTIAAIWTLIYFTLLRRSAGLRHAASTTKGLLAVGLAYGAFVWLVMDLVVLPLSHARPTSVHSTTFWINLAQQALMVGVPIAGIVRAGAR